ncbi:beta-glucan synthesis-associated [Flagelloscypha sp. PMI_526]|nr:beta-glucan synthesis-associated [Flagelloscypha sp. PMI_526]
MASAGLPLKKNDDLPPTPTTAAHPETAPLTYPSSSASGRDSADSESSESVEPHPTLDDERTAKAASIGIGYASNTHGGGPSKRVSSPLNPTTRSSSTGSGSAPPTPLPFQTGQPIPRSTTTSSTLYQRNTFHAPMSPTDGMLSPSSRTPSMLFPAQDGPYPSHLRESTLGYGSGNNRGSMVLYHLSDTSSPTPRSTTASAYLSEKDEGQLLPPRVVGHGTRDSMMSTTSSFDSDSKYSAAFGGGDGTMRSRGQLVPYMFDPEADVEDAEDDTDMLHDPVGPGKYRKRTYTNTFPWRGLANFSTLSLLIGGLLCLFIFYPVYESITNAPQLNLISNNTHVNATGQAPKFFSMPSLIDDETPESAKTRTGMDGEDYVLVFSDEFNTDGRSFYPGDDPWWEAVDLWYGVTADLEWYDPRQITTRDGHLVITIDSISNGQAGVTPGSSSPFTAADNYGLQYRSGMLQSWNKFCFSSGYIEVAVSLPGPNSNTKGYWPGAWTMGNLGRPGYSATTDGMWPYTYDSCDVGTYPNQTNPDKQTPAAALHTDAGRDKYNFELSWLPGQRLSACSCPNSDHPGPIVDGKYRGRGAPEIDIFEAEIDKDTQVGQVISQSAQFAPFNADYNFLNATTDEFQIFNTAKTRMNSYKGSAIQQAVSSVSKVADDGFQGSGARKVVYGFEYWANPSNRDEGFISWLSDGVQDTRMGAKAMAADVAGGSGVSARLIPEEPMSIVLNCGLSVNWQTPDESTMTFPGEMLFDYVRVYQRKGHENYGCDPKDYPTAQYIQDHLDQYSNPNKTVWEYAKPINSAYHGGCT